MKKHLLLLMLLSYQFNTFAQEDAWVYLKDKQNISASIANPISILTQKAIDRKNAHHVVIDAKDVPVNENYITQLKGATGISVMAKSKWFNAVHVRGSKTDIDNLSTTFSFIDYVDFANKSLNTLKSVQQKNKSKLEKSFTTFTYGNAANQIEMFNGNELHLAGYTGAGMTVAIIDAGFPNVNTMSSFQRLRHAGNILDDYDFVNRDSDVYTNTTSNHGTLVLSTMAGYVENEYVGTAPDASYYLFVTEDALSENPVEESYWVEAVERADSLGVDVINTSLGYTTYDNPNYSYTTANMDGNTAFITKGANIAFEKGMLLVNSAGNSGNSSWGIVGAPADAAGVFSIGAVQANGTYASFSSKGNSTQPTQKPDVVAQGQASYVITENDIIATANGTSFSSPIIAGGIVCLWQALSNKTNIEIMQLVRESASQYHSPDFMLGYGIPNLQTALSSALNTTNDHDDENQILKLLPNPTKGLIRFNFPLDQSELSVTIFNVLGKKILETIITKDNNQVDISSFSNGVHIARIQSKNISKTIKLIKY
ncbi:S8 family serine peptidase [Flavivirga abyssicola]|uniref:S8 family serine peptidase n=1 Tax=Flavivirga abyssicola TaxID=3063533 RepID=UPI0026DECAAB|nr:S8 family serine peptidase [Flavivirga sp. MEBiC07777]WVK13332.1 S8 family serine peptidase [Flavivirga sp. MEBiC07777]